MNIAFLWFGRFGQFESPSSSRVAVVSEITSASLGFFLSKFSLSLRRVDLPGPAGTGLGFSLLLIILLTILLAIIFLHLLQLHHDLILLILFLLIDLHRWLSLGHPKFTDNFRPILLLILLSIQHILADLRSFFQS